MSRVHRLETPPVRGESWFPSAGQLLGKRFSGFRHNARDLRYQILCLGLATTQSVCRPTAAGPTRRWPRAREASRSVTIGQAIETCCASDVPAYDGGWTAMQKQRFI